MDVLIDAVREAVELLLGGDRATWEIIWLSLRVSATATAIVVRPTAASTSIEIGSQLRRRSRSEAS